MKNISMTSAQIESTKDLSMDYPIMSFMDSLLSWLLTTVNVPFIKQIHSLTQILTED